MKTQLRRLELIFKFTRIKPEWFYVISFRSDEIILQGRMNSATIKELIKLKFDFKADDCGYMIATSHNITIALT